MKVRYKRMLFIVAGILFSTILPAQELPLMPQDPAVKHSVLPDGLSCYVTENGSSKGMADFALIRRDYSGNEVVLSLTDVVVSSETVIDSTLLALMRRVQKDETPADQAIIVSGDVKGPSVMTKLKYMSFMVDASIPGSVPEYKWEGDGKIRTSCQQDTLKGLSTVRCEWDAPRTSVEHMNTVQSAIYEKAVWEMGKVACGWVKRNLRNIDIPVADASFYHSGCTRGMSDERFAMTVTVSLKDEDKARDEMHAVLSALDNGRVGISDYLLAEKEYLLSLKREAAKVVRSNDEYVRLCTDAFLYNRPLTSAKERLDFFISKDLTDNTRRDLFAGIASALLDIDCQSDTLAPMPAEIMLSDTLSLPEQGLKHKVKSSKKDPFSGGLVWTFDNGFKVIYKKMPTGRTLYYSLSLNGGFANVEDLERGEGAYMSDYLDHSWISGMKGRDFKNLLELSGMTLDLKVNLYNTILSGQVEDRNASLMMKGLLAVAASCRPDTLSVRYYVESERLKQHKSAGLNIRATLDSLMCPGYRYTEYKMEGGINENTFAKAEGLFSDLTSKMNNGMLVIVGDMPETELKKLLQMYVGEFKVRSVAPRRPSVPYHPVSGWLSYTVKGYRDAAVVAVSGMVPMTASNHFAAEVAAMILERRIKEEFKEKGLSARLYYSRSIYPDERFSVFVMLEGECGHEDVLEVKRIISDCSSTLNADLIKACKEYMKNAYSLQMQSPDYWLRVIQLRHLEGKDFTTGCAAKIDAVTSEQIKNIFRTLEKGAGVEYIIKEK